MQAKHPPSPAWPSHRKHRPALALPAILITLAAGCANLTGPACLEQISVDCSQTLGRIRPIHGVNGGPLSLGENPDLRPWFQQAGFPSVRLHDCHWPSPDVVDVHTIFPLFHLDADDPDNYTFTKTDHYIQAILDTGAAIVYRLGESIETHGTRYHINPPPDPDKFARICVNIMRHYNHGWADGHHHGITYWEVWNEPETRKMWTGTQQQYFTLYEKVARALKACDPHVKVGGPALTALALTRSGWARPFVAWCHRRKLPLDFFSFHAYTHDLNHVIHMCRQARRLLDEYGFTETRIHLNEFRFVRSWKGFRPSEPEKWAGMPHWLDVGTGSTGASYAIALLIDLQDEPVDMTNFYSADTSPWSMFGTFGIPRPIYHAYRAFNALVRLARRPAVSVVGQPDKKRSHVLAAFDPDRSAAAILVSTFQAPPGRRLFTIKNLPHNDDPVIQALLIDPSGQLAPIPAKALHPDPQTTTLVLDLPADATCLIRLDPPPMRTAGPANRTGRTSRKIFFTRP